MADFDQRVVAARERTADIEKALEAALALTAEYREKKQDYDLGVTEYKNMNVQYADGSLTFAELTAKRDELLVLAQELEALILRINGAFYGVVVRG